MTILAEKTQCIPRVSSYGPSSPMPGHVVLEASHGVRQGAPVPVATEVPCRRPREHACDPASCCGSRNAPERRAEREATNQGRPRVPGKAQEQQKAENDKNRRQQIAREAVGQPAAVVACGLLRGCEEHGTRDYGAHQAGMAIHCL